MIIGLSGYARSGKDTVADRLVTSHGFIKIGFADSLKEALYTLNPYVPTFSTFPERLSVVVDRLGWEEAKDLHPEVRRLLQRLGTEVGRNLWGENFWVDRLADKVFHLGPDARVVIPDCRFPNEADFVQNHPECLGEVWRIHRPGFEPVNLHASESALDDWAFDRHLTNDKTVSALYETVDYLAERAQGR